MGWETFRAIERVDAVRWYPADGWEDTLCPDGYGVSVMDADHGMINTADGRRNICAGDWIVQTWAGTRVMSNQAFWARYEVVPAGRPEAYKVAAGDEDDDDTNDYDPDEEINPRCQEYKPASESEDH